MTKFRIVQHSFGTPGSGGPIGALSRVLASDITDSFDFLHVAQPSAAGGINIKLILRMAEEMRAFGADLAHVRGLGNEGFHGILAAKLAGVPRILVSVHGSVGDLISGPTGIRRVVVGQICEPLTLRLATHVVTVCEDALRKPVLQATRKKIVGVVPNGVDLINIAADTGSKARHALSIGPEDVVLIVVARLAVDKGGLDLLEAMEALPPETLQKPMHLLFVGDGPDRQLISDRSKSLQNIHVHMLGRRHDVPDLLAASDIAVLPSWHENMSNALLEAMSAGVPVIATSVGGNVEVVTQGGGVLVPPHSPALLAEAIRELVSDAHKRSELGRQGQAVIRHAYTTAHMTKNLENVYRRILEE